MSERRDLENRILASAVALIEREGERGRAFVERAIAVAEGRTTAEELTDLDGDQPASGRGD